MRILLVATAFLLRVLVSLGQGYVPSSPDAMGLARLTAIPVSYYTGAAAISVPLTQVMGKELGVSVSLNYNATGIKVGDVASSVGLGWNLNAGGLITRVVRGQPDDLSNGFCTTDFSDKEPDLFFYNFMGQSGKFILSNSGNAILIPYRNILIKPGICQFGADGTWEIIDENGLRYTFGASSSSRETTTVTPQAGAPQTFVSSWMLSEINSPNLTEKIQFSYTPSSYSTTNYFFKKIKDPCHDDVVVDLSSTISIQTRLISYISAPMGTVFFSYDSPRKDLSSAKYLSGISTMNSTQQIGKLTFLYDYFQSSGCSSSDCFRLKLDKIYDLAPDPLYSFTYNTEVNLPSRFSKNFDHWGYYNNNTIDSWFPEVTSDVASLYSGSSSASFSVSGASREPDASKTLANILDGIQERGGASQQFEFVAHSSGATGNTEIVGGARISSILVDNGAGTTITRTFSYVSEADANLSSGYLHRKPKYAIALVNSSGIATRYLIFSHSHGETFDLNGVHIGYSRVEENFEGSGKSVYYFTNFDSYPDYLDPNTGVVSDFSWKRGNLIAARIYSESSALLSTQIIEYEFDEPNKNQVTWDHVIPWSWSCSCGFLCTNSGNHTFLYKNRIISRPVVMKEQAFEIYDPGNPSKKMIRVTKHEYDPVSYLPNRITTYDSLRPTQKYISETRYVTHDDYDYCTRQYNDCTASCNGNQTCLSDCQTDYDACEGGSLPRNTSGAIAKMRQRHQIAVPVETISFYQDGSAIDILSSVLNIYHIQDPPNSHVQQVETWGLNQRIPESGFSKSITSGSGDFDFDNRMRKLQTNNTFDQTTGNLLQQTSMSGIQSNYTWGYNNSLILATTTTGGVNTRTTTYTHKPLVGLLTTTDANGRVMSNEYDVYNRPAIIKDHDDNILSGTRYHYKGETPGFKISADHADGFVGESFFFSVTDVAASVGGTPRFVWDLGDGTVVDNNSTSLSHSYAQPGNYTVKLVGLNPEYGPVTRALQIEIYPPISAPICADGAVSADLCEADPPVYGDCTQTQNPYYYPVLFSISVTGGCSSSYSYVWEGRELSDNFWFSLNSTTAIASFNTGSAEGTWEIRCTVTDACDNTKQSSYYIYREKSDPDCPVN